MRCLADNQSWFFLARTSNIQDISHLTLNVSFGADCKQCWDSLELSAATRMDTERKEAAHQELRSEASALDVESTLSAFGSKGDQQPLQWTEVSC